MRNTKNERSIIRGEVRWECDATLFVDFVCSVIKVTTSLNTYLKMSVKYC